MRSRSASGLPSTVTLSSSVTFSAAEARTLPFTRTRPAAIHSSASRREHSPARAITLAMRSPSWSFSGVFPREADRSGALRGGRFALKLLSSFVIAF